MTTSFLSARALLRPAQGSWGQSQQTGGTYIYIYYTALREKHFVAMCKPKRRYLEIQKYFQAKDVHFLEYFSARVHDGGHHNPNKPCFGGFWSLYSGSISSLVSKAAHSPVASLRIFLSCSIPANDVSAAAGYAFPHAALWNLRSSPSPLWPGSCPVRSPEGGAPARPG